MRLVKSLIMATIIGAAGCAASSAGYSTGSTLADRGTVAGQVQLKRGKRTATDHSGVIVYLEDVPGKTPDTTNVVHEIRQVEKTFEPEVSVVLKGTTVSFPNDDRVFHNVFSVSRPARFDLGLYKSGTTKTVTLKRAGVVEVFCNIHPQMAAKVLVLDNRYYGRTDKKGDFIIRDVPPGTYRYVAWQPYGKPEKGRVTVRAREVAEFDVELTEGGKPRHKRKDGTLYENYR